MMKQPSTPMEMELMMKLQKAMTQPAPPLKETYQEHLESNYHRKMVKYNTLGRYYVDVQRDPTLFTRIHTFPVKHLGSSHDGLPFNDLGMAVVGSYGFALVLGLFGGLIALGNIPNSHALEHLKPTIPQQFKHNFRYIKSRMGSGKVWVKIGVLFAFAEWGFNKMYSPDNHLMHYYPSILAGGLLAVTKGPWAMASSAAMFSAFTGVFNMAQEHVDFSAMMGGDQFSEIDAIRPPGAPPDWKPYNPDKLPFLMPRDQRVEYRAEFRRQQAVEKMEQMKEQMFQQMMMMGATPEQAKAQVEMQFGGQPGGPQGPGMMGPGGMMGI